MYENEDYDHRRVSDSWANQGATFQDLNTHIKVQRIYTWKVV